MRDGSPPCRRCQGFALEPEVHPTTICTRCRGTGRDPSPDEADLLVTRHPISPAAAGGEVDEAPAAPRNEET
jgi:hypothetical protein